MTKKEVDDNYERLSKQLEELPDTPPVVEGQSLRPFLVVSLIQLICLVVAIIGIVVALSNINEARIETCNDSNNFRLELAGVLYDAQRPDLPPEAKAYFDKQIARFSLIDCKSPTKPRTPITPDMVNLPKTTTSSTP